MEYAFKASTDGTIYTLIFETVAVLLRHDLLVGTRLNAQSLVISTAYEN